jgi:hypothetical protein
VRDVMMLIGWKPSFFFFPPSSVCVLSETFLGLKKYRTYVELSSSMKSHTQKGVSYIIFSYSIRFFRQPLSRSWFLLSDPAAASRQPARVR